METTTQSGSCVDSLISRGKGRKIASALLLEFQSKLGYAQEGPHSYQKGPALVSLKVATFRGESVLSVSIQEAEHEPVHANLSIKNHQVNLGAGQHPNTERVLGMLKKTPELFRFLNG
jgi:hypothetical protein